MDASFMHDFGLLWSVPGVVRGVHPRPDTSQAFSWRLVIESFQVGLRFRELASFAAGFSGHLPLIYPTHLEVSLSGGISCGGPGPLAEPSPSLAVGFRKDLRPVLHISVA